eukprot:c4477_g1_i1.p2 GENE.c4477_g1_i1~~c4477_g1_i1.p2  ORF type:complete len:110 (+),score=25.46 c4477_g1_i1:70-399(+)
MATRMGSSSSSLTITQTTPTTLTVRLECPPEQTRPDEHITWAEDVQDNEGLGKKKSKCCCIFHRPHAWNESSDESDGDGVFVFSPILLSSCFSILSSHHFGFDCLCAFF